MNDAPKNPPPPNGPVAQGGQTPPVQPIQPVQPVEPPKKEGGDVIPPSNPPPPPDDGAAQKPQGPDDGVGSQPETGQKSGKDGGDGIDDQSNKKDSPKDKDVSVGTLNSAEEIIQIFSNDRALTERTALVFKKAKHCSSPISLENDKDLKMFEFTESFITDALNLWLDKRVLVLAGDSNIGKTTTALRLCQKMEETPSMPENSREVEVFRVKPLKPGLKIDLRKIAKDADFSHTVLIFEQFFADGNADLREFFSNFDERELPGLSKALYDQNTFFIFTTNNEKIQAYAPNLTRTGILCTQPRLPKEQLEAWFFSRARSCAEMEGRTAEELETLFAGEKDEINRLFEIWQIPLLNEFINRYLLRILESNGEITVKKAAQWLEGSDKWFLDELTSSTENPSRESAYLDFELWCFVLTLTLTQCVRETTDSASSAAVSWIFFEQFREKITDALRIRLGIPYPKKITLKNYVSEQRWLSASGAEIYPDPDFQIDMIRFKNPRQAEQIWEVLLKNARRVLLMLRPVLEKMATEPHPGIRSTAARILGRIGEIDIEEITFDITGEWIRSGKARQMATVGYLYEGVLSSQNTIYRDLCWKYLEGMHDRGPKAREGRIQNGLWTAIATYKQIGKYMLPETMKQLRKISESTLTDQTQLEKQVAKLPSQVAQEIERRIKDSAPELAGADFHSFRHWVAKDLWNDLRKELLAIYENHPYFMVFKYTLISLCLDVGSFRVFGELHGWFKSDNAELKMLIALNFFREEGIAETLGRYKVELPPSSPSAEKPELMNVIVDDMTHSEDASGKMAAFLEDVFCAFEVSGSSLVKSYYRQQFLQILKGWAKESLQSEEHREVMVELFTLFLKSYISDLKNSVDDFIRGDAEFSDEENPLYLFRQKVFEKSIYG